MLVSPEDHTEIVENTPHAEEFKIWRSHLNSNQIEAIENALRSRIEEGEVHTAGWIPGSKWDEPFKAILEDACGKNPDAAAKCFGIFLWEVIRKIPNEKWSFGRFEKGGVPIRSMTYFKVA